MAEAWVLISLIMITLGVSLGTQLANKKLINQKVMNEYKKRIKDIQVQVRTSKEPKEITKLQTELMDINSRMLKLSFKPMMITMAPLWIMFFVLKMVYEPYGELIYFPFSLPLFGTSVTWLGTYIIFSLLFSLTLKPLITRLGDKFAKTK